MYATHTIKQLSINRTFIGQFFVVLSYGLIDYQPYFLLAFFPDCRNDNIGPLMVMLLPLLSCLGNRVGAYRERE